VILLSGSGNYDLGVTTPVYLRKFDMYNDDTNKIDIDWDHKISKIGCNCNDPIYIAIPPGKTVIIKCPVHGERKLKGSLITLC